jgi:hypothetical protein
MRKLLVLVIYFMASYGLAQEEGRVRPQIETLTVEEGEVTTLHLSPGYATSIRLPEEVSSIMVGNPASFKAEHSESEPQLVFVKPITNQAAESNALITTRSGQEINLHLISLGDQTEHARVDFMVEYKRAGGSFVVPAVASAFLVPATESLSAAQAKATEGKDGKTSLLDQELAQQHSIGSPAWKGKELRVAVGDPSEQDHQTIAGFSVLNASNNPIELLPPQIELSSAKGGKQIKAEPVAISEFRLTSRHLAPGERADGVVAFQRPAFKEASEQLQLQVAEAGSVDRPVLVPLEFVTASERNGQ